MTTRKPRNRIVRALAAAKVALQKLWDREPARVISVAAAVVVFAAAKFGIVLTAQEVVPALVEALPVLLGGEVIRANVTPVK